ncbi:ABC transporter permease [Aurantimonas marianensis]|uniref:ABC transporter permease subunit n=1 Tax=Aurantimonas marianensis TaxID=2920428 RepID=A0A9X2H7M3_9HYPH|nr:ABC transporter permease subunit [Aurantimonas marianensis]MCP3055228.1 ABC transporter permease subunit [Aurantimonas marianensis]
MVIFGHRIPMVGSLILWAILWEIVGRLEITILLPPLSAVLVTLVEIVPTRSFMSALGVTAYAFVIGNVIAIGVGVPLGILMGRSIIADRIFLPWVNLFLSAPLTALVPVIMVLFGLGQTTIILTVVLFAIWIIVLDSRAGVRSISPSLVEMAHSFGANRWQAFRGIYVWAALPEILAGIRLGVIRAVKGVIIGQILVSIVGFGALFKLYGSRFLMEHFWAALLVLFALAFILAESLAWLERRVEFYAASRG